MAKLQNIIPLRNAKGQSAVEYILLLAVISSIAFTVLNNRRFKDLIGGNRGIFETLRKGMEYSYRYGREYKAETADAQEDAMAFQYTSKAHDTYYNGDEGRSRFFSGTEKYPRN